MAPEIRLSSVFDVSINTVEDIEKALKNAESQVSNILDSSPYGISEKFSDRLEQAVDNLDIRHLFDIAHHHSQGFEFCSNITEVKSCYQALLKRSLTVCNDVLTPLLLSSFKCHQTALAHYVNAGQPDESAMAAMAETGEIAQTISRTYKQLSDEFCALKDNVHETIIAACREQDSIGLKEQQIRGDSTDDNPTEKQTLKAGISSLTLSINSLWKIRTQLCEVKRFWDCLPDKRCKSLTDTLLGNPDLIELLQYEVSQEEEKLYTDLKIMELMLRAASAEQPSNLTEVAQSMKTGHNTVKSSTPSTPLTDSVKAMRSGSINQEFEKSYLNWLALAKVNQVMTTALKEIIRMMEIL